MSLTNNQFKSTNVYGAFKVLSYDGILGIGAVPASFDISGNGVFRNGVVNFTDNLPTCTQVPTTGSQLINKTYGDATYLGGGILATNNVFTGTNAFNTSLPTSTVTPTTATMLTTKTYTDTALALKATLASNNTFTGTTNTFTNIVAAKVNDLIVKYDATTNTYASNSYPNTITTGYNNKAFGSDVLTSLTTGYQNVAIGHEILIDCDVGISNIAVGVNLMILLTDGENNSSVGLSNLSALSSGNNNHVYGSANAVLLTTGGSNIIVGSSNLTSATTGDENVCCGSSLLTGVVGGTRNTAVGFDALNAVTSGTHNIGIGSLTVGTGITTGNYNTFVGYNAKASGNYSNCTAIGANASATASNQIVLGSASDTVRCPNTASVVGALTVGSLTSTGGITGLTYICVQDQTTTANTFNTTEKAVIYGTVLCFNGSFTAGSLTGSNTTITIPVTGNYEITTSSTILYSSIANGQNIVYKLIKKTGSTDTTLSFFVQAVVPSAANWQTNVINLIQPLVAGDTIRLTVTMSSGTGSCPFARQQAMSVKRM